MNIDIFLERRISTWQFALSATSIDSSRIVFFAHEIFSNRVPDDTDGACLLGYDDFETGRPAMQTIQCRDMLPKMREAGLHYVTLPYIFHKGTKNENDGRIHIVTKRITGVRRPDVKESGETAKGVAAEFKGYLKRLLFPQTQIDLGDCGEFIVADCFPFRAVLAVKVAQMSQNKR